LKNSKGGKISKILVRDVRLPADNSSGLKGRSPKKKRGQARAPNVQSQGSLVKKKKEGKRSKVGYGEKGPVVSKNFRRGERTGKREPTQSFPVPKGFGGTKQHSTKKPPKF